MIEQLLENQKQLLSGDLPIKAGQDEEFSIASSVEVDEARQGDLYIRIVNTIPDGYKKHKPFLQMVPGNTTGSKHCWERLPDECYIPKGWTTNESYDGLLGPIVKNYTPNVLQHSQHGNITFSQKEFIQFGYQKSQDVEEEKIRRQLD